MGQRALALAAVGALLLGMGGCGRWAGQREARGAASATARPTVAVVRSDMKGLPHPAPAEAVLTTAQIEDVVRRACQLGGLRQVIERAAAAPRSDTLWVAIKPNIVELKPGGSGVVTDWRVVRAVVRLVHELAPAARITIAEGGAWVPPERQDVRAAVPSAAVGDGFAVAGYRQLLSDPDLRGVRLDIVDLNFDDPQPVPVPGGGYAQPSFEVPRTVRLCDVLIDVPVAKIIGVVQMTAAMKNLVGTAPGTVYGWGKASGYPPSGHAGIPHHNAVLGETIADLTALAGVDFTVADAIVAMEKAKTDEDGGQPVRLNTVVAGADIVAVDAVCAQLMGLNPADIEYITLAQMRGMGTGRPEQIRIVGQPVAQVGRRFEKYPASWGDAGAQGHYGQGNRLWTVRGPIPLTQWQDGLIDPAAAPVAGADGWSKPLFFHDDRIDLDRYLDGPTDCMSYAYSQIEAPAAGAAELWVGSDEGLRVWLNGRLVYQFSGRRRHRLPCDRVPVALLAGRNTCLIEARQGYGGYDFSMKLCEPESDARYDGRTVTGLHYTVPSPAGAVLQEVSAAQRQGAAEWFDDSRMAADPSATAHLELAAFIPGQVECAWIGLDTPRVWGRSMRLQGGLVDGHMTLTTDNLQAFHLDRHGPLANGAAGLRLTVDGHPVDAAGAFGGTRVRLEADTTGWRALPATAEPQGEIVVGEVVEPLPHVPPPGQLDTPMGDWFTDAERWATGADVVLQNAGGIRSGLSPGPLPVRALFAANFPDELCTFQVSGAELLQILEHGLGAAEDAVLQLSGVEYSVDRQRPAGARVVRSTVEPSRIYTVAAEDYLCERGERFFGRDVRFAPSGVHVVDAVVRYAQHVGQISAPTPGRIRLVPVTTDR